MRAHLQAKATPEHRKARAEYVREDLPGTVDEQLAYRLRMIHAMSKIEKQYEVAELTELLPT